MAKGGHNKHRKRVAKTLSKAFRKLEVGQHQTQQQPQQPSQPNQSKPVPHTNRLRKRQGFQQRELAKNAQVYSEKAEFDREQASLNERFGKRDRKKSNSSTIQLQPPTFSLGANEDAIQRGFEALQGFGNDSRITYNPMGEATATFLFQQAQKSVAESEATARTNRFAALLEYNHDNDDENNHVDPGLMNNQSTPTSIHGSATPAIHFPPPLFHVARPKMKDMPEAPLLASLDSDL